jgi:hypothetical protein
MKFFSNTINIFCILLVILLGVLMYGCIYKKDIPYTIEALTPQNTQNFNCECSASESSTNGKTPPLSPNNVPPSGANDSGANDSGANDSGANDSGANDTGATPPAPDNSANDDDALCGTVLGPSVREGKGGCQSIWRKGNGDLIPDEARWVLGDLGYTDEQARVAIESASAGAARNDGGACSSVLDCQSISCIDGKCVPASQGSGWTDPIRRAASEVAAIKFRRENPDLYGADEEEWKRRVGCGADLGKSCEEMWPELTPEEKEAGWRMEVDRDDEGRIMGQPTYFDPQGKWV